MSYKMVRDEKFSSYNNNRKPGWNRNSFESNTSRGRYSRPSSYNSSSSNRRGQSSDDFRQRFKDNRNYSSSNFREGGNHRSYSSHNNGNSDNNYRGKYGSNNYKDRNGRHESFNSNRNESNVNRNQPIQRSRATFDSNKSFNAPQSRSTVKERIGQKSFVKSDLRAGMLSRKYALKGYMKKIRLAKMRTSLKVNDDEHEPERKSPTNDGINPKKVDTNLKDAEKSTGDSSEVQEDKSDNVEDNTLSSDSLSKKQKVKVEKDTSVKIENNDKNDESRSRHSKSTRHVQLKCVHCNFEYKTFRAYTLHLHKRAHKMALHRVAIQIKRRIHHLQMSQRQTQNKIDSKIMDTKSVITNFCNLCKLNFRQPEIEHKASTQHQKMLEFIKPYCKVCKIYFTTPMKYELHRSSLEHILKKDQKVGNSEPIEESDESIDVGDLDILNFTTVDSIGEIEDDDLSINEDSDIKPMSKYIKKVEVNYCSLCQVYIPHLLDQDEEIEAHCSSKIHEENYQNNAMNEIDMSGEIDANESEMKVDSNQEIKTEMEDDDEDEEIKSENAAQDEDSNFEKNSDDETNTETMISVKEEEKNSNEEKESNVRKVSKFTRYLNEQSDDSLERSSEFKK